MAEVVIAAVCVGFLTGFVAVLCIGNYFRAKRAMERQRQRRLAHLANGGNGYVDSPRSHYSSSGTSGGSTTEGDDENQLLLHKTSDIMRRRLGEYEDYDLFLSQDETRPTVTLMRV